MTKKNGIPVKDVEKATVARNEDEDSRLKTLFEREITTGIELEIKQKLLYLLVFWFQKVGSKFENT